MLLACFLVSMDLKSDLSDLTAAARGARKDAALVGWADLAKWRGDGTARMIGYMMDGNQAARDGAPVNLFILMPEAGQFLHPAHPQPEEMVEVRTKQPVAFKFRQLVWATGRLSRTTGGDREHAAWAMTDARVQPASDGEITAWFGQ